MPRKVAVIGAGVAGLSAAGQLVRGGCEVTVFEAESRPGGRVASGRHGRSIYDYGAQFFRTEGGPAEDLLLRQLPIDELVDIREDVLPFTADGTVGQGDATQNALPKWTYRTGIGRLGELLAAWSGADLRLGTAVQRLRRGRGGWDVVSTSGHAIVGFDDLLLTLPPDAASRLLEGQDVEGLESVRGLLAGARYRALITVAFGLEREPPRPAGCYALVNSDRAHAVSWLAFEYRKPGYTEGEAVLVAQMADGWSAPRLDQPGEELVAAALPEVAGLLGGPQFAPDWSAVHRWPEALPGELVPEVRLAAAEGAGLFFAGDMGRGGRVHLAVESGMAAAGRISAALGR